MYDNKDENSRDRRSDALKDGISGERGERAPAGDNYSRNIRQDDVQSGDRSGSPAAQKSNSFSRNHDRDGEISWGKEIVNSGRTIGRVGGRVLGYILNFFLTILLIVAITGVIVGAAFLIYVNNYIDPEIDLSAFSINQDHTTTIYYTDYSDRENGIGEEKELEDQRLYGSENSLWASYGQMTKNHKYLVRAFVAAEDRRFFSHNGVDWLRTLSAVRTFIFPSGDRVFGASTITQQLVKNITGDNEATIERKVQEIVRALNLEKQKSKEEILEMYLNIVYLSENCYGVQAAANTYFSKDVSDLTLVECAALAAIVQSPSAFDPYTRPERNKVRRDAILNNMYEYGYISEDQLEEALDTELEIKLNREGSSTNVATNSWFTDTLINDIINDLVLQKGYSRTVASNLIFSGGLKIHSTVDPKVQEVLEEEFEDDSNFPEFTGIKPESAMVVIDPATGDVLGIVGGRTKSGNRVQNHATMSKRPPGSSIKPVAVYGPALEYGLITYSSIFDDVPVNFGDDPEDPSPWPHNYPDTYGGLTTVADAIRRSVNTVSVRILQKLTIDRSFDFIHNKLNCTSIIEGITLDDGRYITDKGVAALALGQLEYGITVRELTSAYSMIANRGVYNKSRTYITVEDANGKILLSNQEQGTAVMSEQNAYILTKMMQDVVASGTATAITLDEKLNVAGKTGTTSSDYDRWFVGFTPYYVGGIWLGFEYPKSLSTMVGSPHVRLWDKIMTRLHEDFIADAYAGVEPLREFEEPSGIVKMEYCACSGKLVTEACKLDPRGSTIIKTGYYTASSVPTEACNMHVKVKVCRETGCLLGPDCDQDESNVTYRGLVKLESRSFPMEVGVSDAQYIYRELPKDVEPGKEGEPFFINLLDEEEYVGTSGVAHPYNEYCYKHFDKSEFEKRATEENTTVPEDTTVPPDESTSPPDTGPEDTDEPSGDDTTHSPPVTTHHHETTRTPYPPVTSSDDTTKTHHPNFPPDDTDESLDTDTEEPDYTDTDEPDFPFITTGPPDTAPPPDDTDPPSPDTDDPPWTEPPEDTDGDPDDPGGDD